MDLIVAVVLVAAVAVGVWWFLKRRTPPPAEDEWTLPPEGPARTTVQDLGPQLLDRDTLARRDRHFDPRGWDDTPDGTEGADDDVDNDGEPIEDLPRFFDRDYLKRRQDDTPEP